MIYYPKQSLKIAKYEWVWKIDRKRKKKQKKVIGLVNKTHLIGQTHLPNQVCSHELTIIKPQKGRKSQAFLWYLDQSGLKDQIYIKKIDSEFEKGSAVSELWKAMNELDVEQNDGFWNGELAND